MEARVRSGVADNEKYSPKLLKKQEQQQQQNDFEVFVDGRSYNNNNHEQTRNQYKLAI